jgi:hypothetical protein
MPKKAASLYVERSIDSTLRSLIPWWLEGTKETHWVTLTSQPGRGNTSLLTRFSVVLGRERRIRRRFRTILVRGEQNRPGSAPRPLGPLETAVYELSNGSRLSGLRRFGRRLREASALRLVLMLAVFLSAAALACVFVGFSEYIVSQDLGARPLLTILAEFFTSFLPRHWKNLPLWLLAASIISLPFVWMTRLLPQASPREPGPDDIRLLETREGLADTLADLCRGKQGLILLIDDARWLKDREIDFLTRLFTQDPDLHLPRLRSLRLLVVALDWYEDGQDPLVARSKDKPQPMPVPPFDLLQLRSIFLTQVPAAERQGLDEDEVLREAHGNVRLLFALRDRRLAEEMGREISQARQDEIDDRVFGLAELMIYQVASQSSPIDKKEIRAWLESDELRAHLRDFGIEPLDRARAPELIKQLCKSSLMRVAGRTCYLDAARSTALLGWMQGHDPAALARAHFFWFSESLRQVGSTPPPENVASLAPDRRQALQKAAWHAEWLVQGAGGHDVLAQAPTLGDEQRRERRLALSGALLASAVLWRSEGEPAKSIELIEAAWKALDPADAAGEPAQILLDHMWRNYWVCGDARLRETIREHTQRLPSPGAAAVHQRFEELLLGRTALSPPPPLAEPGDPFLIDLHRLTEVIWSLRQAHGFVLQGLEGGSEEIPDPLPALSSRAEFHLRYYRCLLQWKRRDLPALRASLLAWRDRLVDLESLVQGHLGDEVFGLFERARYAHLLVEIAETSPAAGEEDDRATAQELAGMLEAASLPTFRVEGELQDRLWAGARQAYEQTLYLAALLRWPTLVLEATFGLATLLLLHSPERIRREDEQWQQSWDERFGKCIEIERSLGWTFYQPEIHRLRHQFFQNVSSELSVEDAYNTLLAIRAAHYPIATILDWHHYVSILLNNYANSDNDRRRSADLYLTWARELAALPEAAGKRTFPVLQHEQADSLHFAAQAMRFLNETEAAEALLNEAEELLAPVPPPTTDPAAADPIRDLRISLKLQRAWLLGAQDRFGEHAQLVREIWRMMRRGDESLALILVSLVGLEAKEGLLQSSWPPHPGAALETDPDNAELSLPKGWLAGDRIESRIEFRIHQLLSLLPGGAPPDSGPLRIVAASRWLGVKQFAESWLRVAELAYKQELAFTTRGLMSRVLEAVAYYFAEVEKVDSKELDSLRLLMAYAPDPSRYRDRYTAALVEYENLLKRELLVQVASEQPDWKALAERVNEYLGTLVDHDLLAQRLAASLDEDAFQELSRQQSQKHAALERARLAYGSGSIDACRQLLRPVLPAQGLRWVFLEDIFVLDLWLRCHAAQPGDEQDFTERADQLRQLALRFIRQFSNTISEPHIQRLVLELLETATLFGRTQARAAVLLPQEAPRAAASALQNSA